MDTDIADTPAQTAAPAPIEHGHLERRRPGRPAQVSTELVGLLRWQPSADHAAIEVQDADQQGWRAAEGLMLGSLGGCLLWTGLILTARQFLS